MESRQRFHLGKSVSGSGLSHTCSPFSFFIVDVSSRRMNLPSIVTKTRGSKPNWQSTILPAVKTVFVTSSLCLDLPSSATILSPKEAIAGDEMLPNVMRCYCMWQDVTKWDECPFIRYSIIGLEGSLSCNHNNRKKFWCLGLTWKLWNICSTSAMMATSPSLNFTSMFIWSGPCSRTSFRETPSNPALASKTTLIPAFLGCLTASKWGRWLVVGHRRCVILI